MTSLLALVAFAPSSHLPSALHCHSAPYCSCYSSLLIVLSSPSPCVMSRSSSPTILTLYDASGSLVADNEFRDEDGNSAYYYQIHKRNPLSTKITRLPDWVATGAIPGQAGNSNPEPWTAWLYFTSNERVEGYLKIGKDEPTPMYDHLRQKRSSQ